MNNIFNLYKRNLFVRMLELLSIKYSRKYSSITYETNPRKRCFQGLKELFSGYGIDCDCYQFENTTIEELPTPFIAVLSGDFFIIENCGDGVVKIFHNETSDYIKESSFYKGWNGQALIINSIDNAVEPNYKEHLRSSFIDNLLLVATISAVAYIICWQLVNNFTIERILYILIDIAGLFFSFLSLDAINSSAKKKLCSAFSERGCEKVHDSKAAYFLNKYSLGEIGVSYFISNILICVLLKNFLQILIYINIVASIFAVWSILYQKIVVKAWCPICLFVQAAVLIKVVCCAFFGRLALSYTGVSHIFTVISVYIIVFYLVAIFYTLYKSSTQNEELSFNLSFIKSNIDVFNNLLRQKKRFDTGNTGGIVFGRKDSTMELTVVLNPFCGPCKLFHKKLHILLESNYLQRYKLRILFIAFSREKEKVVSAFIGYILHHSERESLSLINDWYEHQDIKAMMIIFEKYKNEKEVMNEMNTEEIWLDTNNITATPTVLFNGYLFPDAYDVTDLKSILSI